MLTAPVAHPRIAVTPEWGAALRRAREAAGLTQAELGARVRASQATIHLLEEATTKVSALVIPLSKEMGLALPHLHRDEFAAEWHDLGAELQGRDPALFAQAVSLVKTILLATSQKKDS